MKTLQRGLFKVSGDTVNTLSMLILTLYNVFNKLKFVFNYSKFIYPEVTWLCQKCSLILFVYYTIHICWLTSISEPVIPAIRLKEIGERYDRELAA